MAGAQIVEKILAQIGNGIYVENEKVRPIVHNEALGLCQITGKIDLGGRRGFPQRRENFRSEVLLGFEHKNAPALFERILRMRRFFFVHDSKRAAAFRLGGVVRHALIRHACFRANEKYFSQATDIRNASAGRSAAWLCPASRVFCNAPLRRSATPAVQKELRTKLRRGSACVYVCRDAMPRVVDARGDPVAAIGFHGRAAAAESCQEDDDAKGE